MFSITPETFTAAPEVGGFSQAAIGVPGAVWGEGLRECAFENCNFTHIGNYALELGRGSQSNRISRCDFGDLDEHILFRFCRIFAVHENDAALAHYETHIGVISAAAPFCQVNVVVDLRHLERL